MAFSETLNSLVGTAGQLAESSANVYTAVRGNRNTGTSTMQPQQQQPTFVPSASYPNAGTSSTKPWVKWAMIGGGGLVLVVILVLVLRRRK
jgi:hypothetical protein